MEEKDKTDKLFNGFPPVSTREWKEKIIADLKGADYDKKLIWKTDEGFNVNPFYRAEDLDNISYLSTLPAEKPYTRGLNRDSNEWKIRQDIYDEDFTAANRIALDAISNGAQAIGLNVKEVTSHKQMQQILEGIDISATDIHFISSRSYPLTLELCIYEATHRRIDGSKIHGSLNFDPISYLLLHGDFYQSKESNLDEAEYLITTLQKRLPEFRAITINGNLFRNAGATVVQELAFSLASANDYLSELTSKGLTVDTISPKILFSFGIGPDYFLEIAKLRAARLLWTALVEQYKPQNPESSKMFIHSTTSLWNKSIYDPYVNMLRTTTEGMAAAIGNADSISILPYDVPFRKEDEFSRRIARNQQLILKEEAYLDRIVDPSAGSYYIENLTHSIAAHSWELFKTIEEHGGMIESILSGFIQDEIKETCRKKDLEIAHRRIILIGTNQYANPLESMSAEIHTLQSPVPDKEPSKYKKLHIYRGARAFEEVRLATENFVIRGNKKPVVFLLTIGNPGMRKARATFAVNFFGCAGYEIIDNPGFSTVPEGIKAALGSGADIVVICSSDEEYPAMVPPVCSGIKAKNKKARIVVAGYPKEAIDSLKAAGVDDFIHVRTNVLEFLRDLQRKLGIM